MALIQFGANIVDARGKQQGTTFSRNKGGNFSRNTAIPTNPNTVHQSTQRGYMATLAKYWNTVLSDTERNSWIAYGKTHQTISPFGAPRILQGNAAFIQLNRIILAASGTIEAAPPVSLAITSLTSASLAVDHLAATAKITFTPTPMIAPEGLYVFATAPLSPGISNITTHLRLLKFYSAATSPLDITSDWVARFGAIPAAAGQRVGIAIAVVNNTTGASTPKFVTSTLIV